MWPNRSDFNSTDPRSAWWYTGVSDSPTEPMASARVCATVGGAFITRLQQLLRASVAPNITVSGIANSETLRALSDYATLLAQKLDDPSARAVLPDIEANLHTADAHETKMRPHVTRFALWVTFHRNHLVVDASGQQDIKAPPMTALPFEQVQLSVQDLSDQTIACVRENMAARPGDELCQEWFEATGSTDAKLPIVRNVVYITSPTPMAEKAADDAGPPVCTLFNTALASLSGAVAQLGNEERTFLRWKNWIAMRRANSPGKPMNAPEKVTPTAASGFVEMAKPVAALVVLWWLLD